MIDMDLNRRAVDSYRNDVRFRALADHIVARVMHEHGPVDHERPDRDAHDIAKRATALLLQSIYEKDAELGTLRAERDRYRKIAEDALSLSPPPPVVIHQSKLA